MLSGFCLALFLCYNLDTTYVKGKRLRKQVKNTSVFDFCLESLFCELECVIDLNAARANRPISTLLDQGLDLEYTIKDGHHVYL